MTTPTICIANTVRPRERVLFLLAGTATRLSAALAAAISPWFLLMTTGIGLNQLLLVATSRCPASVVVDRLSAGRTS
jgi:hypothetical protein